MTIQPGNESSRIQSVDFIRGLVMVLMAIDHVRVYSGLPAGGPDPGIFFTRWVTHFCAPVFVFLTGTAAFLYGIKVADKTKLRNYLLTRGLLLIILELTLIRFFWTFNFNYGDFILAGVIWMIGWCMVLLGLMINLGPRSIGFAGLAIIFFQDIFALVPGILPESSRASFGLFWEFIYSSGLQGPSFINILYVIVPWIGVMMAGYGFGTILMLEEQRRKRILVSIGLAATAAFVIGGTLVILLGPEPENPMPFVMRLLNQRKYPASQLYLLMTLGPAILLMPFVENAKNAFAKAIIIFGRVPFFYYLLHILLIHFSALIVAVIREGIIPGERYDTAPFTWFDEQFHWNLGLLYLVFVIDVIILYFACRWYAAYKAANQEKGWVKYI